ncbi:MAG: tetratricopeptide repeat protein [Acidobacteria bacterium]|nr:tetratricopeptide repeat protein [Acidobacteriota bacterium]MBE3131664.1 tetratricopeptide repeat protein [Acidobacteriota bacterium]
MKYRIALGLTVLSLALTMPAQDNLGRGRINGNVVDESGVGIHGALVVAEFLGGGTRLDTKTDTKGHFAMGGMGSGAWRITASKEGYANAVIDMPVSQLKSNSAISLTLKKISGLEALQSDEQGRTLLEQGNALLEAERYDEAVAAYGEFALKYPEIYGVHLSIGTAYMKKGDLDRAEAEFQSVLEKEGQTQAGLEKPKNTSLRALSGLGEVALRRGDFAAAQGAFRRALEISPEDPATAYNVGEIFFSNQKIDEAITYFELAAKIKQDWPRVYHRLGLAYLNKGDFDKALANLRKFIELDPQNAEVANVRATIAAIEKMKK